MKSVKLYLGLSLFICISLTACKSRKSDDDIITPAQEIYRNGLGLLEKHKYTDAAEEFDKVFFQHPGNDITPQAELMRAYSLFLAAQYGEAIDTLEMFIRLHPLNEDIAYAYYLNALSYYMQISSVRLDQSMTSLAKIHFEELIRRFPNTKYAIDGLLKIDLVNDHLAGQEMEIGRYYLHNKNPIAAIKRFQQVIENFETTSHTAEALYRLVICYLDLGLPEEARKYAAVLGNNYINSSWYKYSYDLLSRVK